MVPRVVVIPQKAAPLTAGSKIKAQRPGSLWLEKQKDNAKTFGLLCPFERLNFSTNFHKHTKFLVWRR